jgi:hypothetical protein
VRDDLFEFLAAQEAGRDTEKGKRAAEKVEYAADVRSIVDKIKSHKRLDRAPSKTKR